MNLASQDALTWAFNKRKFDEIYAGEVARAQQTVAPLTFMLFDIDFFKRINDQYGHPAGDAVLQGIAHLAQAVVGHSGVFCRVGGEEFAIILPGLPLLHAVKLAEYLRRAVEQQHFMFEERSIPVTISIGISELLPVESSETLYNFVLKQRQAVQILQA
jgi:two-component system, cell cycle response regulator